MDAFFEDYGSPDSDQGEWVEIGSVNGQPVRLRIRPVPQDIAQANIRRYTRNEIVTDPDGSRAARPVTKDWADNIEFAIAQATHALVDSENLTVKAVDEESATFFGKAMGRAGQVKAGDIITLDGNLTDKIKGYILRRSAAIRDSVIKQSDAVAKRRTEHIRVLEGNS